MRIRIYYDSTKYRFRDWRKAEELIKKVIRNKNMVPGDLSFIITTDDVLKEINKEFLNHDYNTDVIAFDYSVNSIINGEIYISYTTVKLNAHNYNVSLKNEMLRVMIHGILHLTGYDDKKEDERKMMRNLEDRWLAEMEGK